MISGRDGSCTILRTVCPSTSAYVAFVAFALSSRVKRRKKSRLVAKMMLKTPIDNSLRRYPWLWLCAAVCACCLHIKFVYCLDIKLFVLPNDIISTPSGEIPGTRYLIQGVHICDIPVHRCNRATTYYTHYNGAYY